MLTKQKPACRILIVEDDRIARSALVRLLRHLGYQTVEAATVAEGLAVLNGQQFAIVDLNLPDGAGTTILKRIRDENHPMRVAVASGTSDENLWAEAQSYKPDLLLRKPIDMNQLLAWLEAAG